MIDVTLNVVRFKTRHLMQCWCGGRRIVTLGGLACEKCSNLVQPAYSYAQMAAAWPEQANVYIGERIEYCEACGDTGSVECGECYGEGFVECCECGADKECDDCDGS